ncbi:LruC domain-containing protein [Pseudoalteromonas sp.]|uniref:LruC domain-containing protein n=1 Tax=Pseudoalteromonas sp. TaxID=53249 RepID=UPI002629DA32|nr:LruC domain-containing protein [Pseudoalteromonas sp.]MCP4588059.1 LruC domain-containing protein [Pseudoalteromonas sp.]
MKSNITVYLLFALATGFVSAAPFQQCPSKAFLIQGKPAQMFGVDLVSAKSTVLAATLNFTSEANNESVNAVGFNYKDQYMYGFSKQSPKSVVRIGDEYILERLNVNGLPDTNFYVGDIQVNSETNQAMYYLYHPKFGLFGIDLTEPSDAYQAELVADSANWGLAIYDFAFHPHSNLLYAVESNGDLYEIDLDNKTPTFVANLDIAGDTGANGASYFDVQGQFYFSNNRSGKIHKVDLGKSPVDGYTPTASVFTLGPTSNQNDGARCAIAEVKVTDNSIDFGDAPMPYKTVLADSGARHLFDPNEDQSNLVYLGAYVDGENINIEADLQASPVDSSDDGVKFVTDFVAGSTSQVIVTAPNDNGYLYAWFDWDQNFQFDSDEITVSKYRLNQGDNSVLVDVPSDAVMGATWARFRVTDGSELSPITASGGVTGGEVEDYPVTTYGSLVYPSENGWVTLAYEDQWPFAGDYDFNDLVVNYRTKLIEKDGQALGYKIEGELVGIGASYHNGFAVRLAQSSGGSLKRILRNQVNESEISLIINNEVQTHTVLEEGVDDAILIIMPDTWSYVSSQSGCSFFRTENGCYTSSKVGFTLSVSLNTGVSSVNAPKYTLDPFIFGAAGFSHGQFLSGKDPRSWEVHLKNQAPTEKFDQSFFNYPESDDASNNLFGYYFQSPTGLPWAIEVGAEWAHPKEKVDITLAYSEFKIFAESSGRESTLWFNSAKLANVILRGE